MIIKNKQKVSKKLHKKLKVFYLTIICNFLDDILNYQEAYFAEIGSVDCLCNNEYVFKI